MFSTGDFSEIEGLTGRRQDRMSGAEGCSSSSSNSPSSTDNGTSFQRIPSEGSLLHMNKDGMSSIPKHNKPWERSQSAMDLKNNRIRSASVDYIDTSTSSTSTTSSGGKVSEHSKVYWDLSQADDDLAAARASGGKFKISLQTIHQKEEMTSRPARPAVSIQARVVRRMSSESSLLSNNRERTEYAEITLPAPESPTTGECCEPGECGTPTKTHTKVKFNFEGKSLNVTLEQAIPILQENIEQLKAKSEQIQCIALDNMLCMIEEAWATPSIGRDLAYGLCDVLKDDGGLDILIKNCANNGNHSIQLGSAQVLAQSMTVGNRAVVAGEGLEIIVQMANSAKDDNELTKASTGILESLFKQSEDTCAKVIKLGGLDSILYSCRNIDIETLRHCAEALANLAMYGGTDNQQEMISHKAAEWLFPLAFSQDDTVRYYAFLAISALSANKEIESAVVKSGTLELVKPFILTHDPSEFAQSDKAHIHGQSKAWLERLVPLLSSKREEAQALAAFHFAMEAGIKAEQGHREVVFKECGAIKPLKHVACGTNTLASKFAAEALEIIGEEVPYKLTQKVPLWNTQDVKHWLQQAGFGQFCGTFEACEVDGDMLLLVSEENLKEDLDMTNGITRKRFMRELTRLKRQADYDSCDPTKLSDWLLTGGNDLSQYTYQMITSGADRSIVRYLNDDNLKQDCCINNGIHRLKIMENAKKSCWEMLTGRMSLVGSPDGFEMADGPMDKPIDVFISYRRSNGSQLASLLKVHLQLRGFTVFLDIEKLRAGKFDDNLLSSVSNAKNFILVLTPNCLDRCIGDSEHKDWVHREVVAAIEGGCNIIPVMDNFQWPTPESLPEDMRGICWFNGIRWIHDYQDACVDKMEKFIRGEQMLRPPLSKGNSLSSQTDSMHPTLANLRSTSLDTDVI